jgi:hypothetical protein
MRYFNVAGPCNKAKHYMIEASTRLQGVEDLIDMKQYFVIHAARQSDPEKGIPAIVRTIKSAYGQHTTEPADPIYTEVIVRTLNYDMQRDLQQLDSAYQI